METQMKWREWTHKLITTMGFIALATVVAGAIPQ